MATVILTGDKALDQLLQQLVPRLQKRAFSRASRAAAKPIRDAARRNAPSDTGRLARSIKVRAARRSRSRVGIRVTTGDGGEFTGKSYYGGFLEYGFRRGKRTAGIRRAQRRKTAAAGDSRPEVPGVHFMRRAADEQRAAAAAIFNRVIRAEIAAELATVPRS